MAGLNGKLSEVNALLGQLRLADFDRITARRNALHNRYRSALPELNFQSSAPGIQAHQFVPALLPAAMRGQRTAIREELANRGITTGTYFSPHLLEQPYFQKMCIAGPMPVCEDVSARMISLPLFDTMTDHEVDQVAECLNALMGTRKHRSKWRKPSRGEQHVPLVYADVKHAAAGVTVE
jgi:dTDP-4-amino-4,6-dideoxygalactose transaminase